jgi:hypothetical protein
MADRELIAAILTAGMLPTLEIPRSRLQGTAEAHAIQCAVDHAFGLYRLVLNELGADPFASRAEPGAQPRRPRSEIGQQASPSMSVSAMNTEVADLLAAWQPRNPWSDREFGRSVRTFRPMRRLSGITT